MHHFEDNQSWGDCLPYLPGLSIIAILSLACVVLHAVWAYAAFNKLGPRDSIEAYERIDILQRFRWVVFSFTLFQLLCFVAVLGLQVENEFFSGVIVFFSLILHGQVEFAVEKRIRGIRVSLYERSKMLFRGIFGAFALYGVYFAAIGFSTAGALGLFRWLGFAGWVEVAAIIPGILVGLFTVSVLSPFLIRILMPCERVKDPILIDTLDRCFLRAHLPQPSYWYLKLDRYQVHNAMVAGFYLGKKLARPAVFITQSLLEQLSSAEFEAIMLHEVSHLKLKHNVTRTLGGFFVVLASMVLTAIFALIALLVVPDGHQLMGVVLFMLLPNVIQLLLMRKVVRRQEIEADEFAIHLGARLEDLAGALKKLTLLNDQSSQKRNPNSFLNVASAHPTLDERVQILYDRRAQGYPQRDSILKEFFAPLANFAVYWVPATVALLAIISFYGVFSVLPTHQLRMAAREGNLSRVQELLARGVRINTPDKLSFVSAFPLSSAASAGQLSMVRFIVENGGRVNQSTNEGVTPLMAASAQNHSDIVIYLLEKGAEINKDAENGATALSFAARAGNLDVVKVLIAKGATLDFHDLRGFSPLGLALSLNHLDVAMELRKAGAKDVGRYRIRNRGIASLSNASP